MASEHIVNLKVKFESDAKAGIKATADSLKSNLGGALKDTDKKSKELKASLTNFKELGKIFKDIAPDIGAPFAKGTKLASEMVNVLPKLSGGVIAMAASVGVLAVGIGAVLVAWKAFGAEAQASSPALKRDVDAIRESYARWSHQIAKDLTPVFKLFTEAILFWLPKTNAEIAKTSTLYKENQKTLEDYQRTFNLALDTQLSLMRAIQKAEARSRKDEQAERKLEVEESKDRINSRYRDQIYASKKLGADTTMLEQAKQNELQKIDVDAKMEADVRAEAATTKAREEAEKKLQLEKATGEKRKALMQTFFDFEAAEKVKMQAQIDNRISNSQRLKLRNLDEELSNEETSLERQKEILAQKYEIEMASANAIYKDEYQIALFYESLLDALDENAKNKKIKNSDEVAKKEKENIDKMSQARFAAAGASANLLGALAAMTKSGTKVSRQEANIAKGLAIGEATINTFAGATRAYKDFPYPMSAVISGLVVATGLANVAAIANQKFAKGGLIPAGERSITVNEAGQESVLNARATSRLGREGVDRLNRGEGGSSGITISYAPTFNGSTTMEAVGAINRHTDEELRRLAKNIQDIKVRGITP